MEENVEKNLKDLDVNIQIDKFNSETMIDDSETQEDEEEEKDTAGGWFKNQIEKDLVKLSKLPRKMKNNDFEKKTQLRCKVIESIITTFTELNEKYSKIIEDLLRETIQPSKKSIFFKSKKKLNYSGKYVNHLKTWVIYAKFIKNKRRKKFGSIYFITND